MKLVPWFDIILKGNLNELVKLYDGGVPFPEPFEDVEGNSPFHCAAQAGSIELFQFFEVNLQKKAPLKLRNNSGETPLLVAVESQNIAMITYLLSRGSSVDEKDYRGVTCLMAAVYTSNYNITKQILENGGSLEERTNRGETCLMAAASDGNVEIIEYLLSMGSCINGNDDTRETPLLLASCLDHPKAVQCLLDAGAMENARFPFADIFLPVSIDVMLVLWNGGFVSLEEIQAHYPESRFAEYMVALKRIKAVKRAS